jgi:hypothetical protein
MRYLLLSYQTTEAWNGLSPQNKGSEEIAARWPDAQHWGMEIRALMHRGGEEG